MQQTMQRFGKASWGLWLSKTVFKVCKLLVVKNIFQFCFLFQCFELWLGRKVKRDVQLGYCSELKKRVVNEVNEK